MFGPESCNRWLCSRRPEIPVDDWARHVIPCRYHCGMRWSPRHPTDADRKSTRLNSSHGYISYAVFCLKKKSNRPVEPVALLGHLPIHFMSRSTETSRTGTILPSFTMTSRARLVGRCSSLMYVNGYVIPHGSNSRRLSSDFLSDSPVSVVPERLIA